MRHLPHILTAAEVRVLIDLAPPLDHGDGRRDDFSDPAALTAMRRQQDHAEGRRR